MKVYLGGGLGVNSEALKVLKSSLKIDHFDPSSLPDDFHSFKISKEEWSNCDYCLYVLTPLMKGFDMVVNAVDDSNKRPNKTMYCFVNEDVGAKFTEHQIKSLKAIGETVKKNGATWFESLEDAITFLNAKENH
jgi:hypothetical protein